MTITDHIFGKTKVAEVHADDLIIRTTEDGLDLLGNLYYQGFDGIIIHERNISPEFFDLKTGLAGEILQKFSTYRVWLAIVGDFSKFPGKSLQEFIFESNKGKFVNFLSGPLEALAAFSKRDSCDG